MQFTCGRNRLGEGTPVQSLVLAATARHYTSPGEGEGLAEETWFAGASPLWALPWRARPLLFTCHMLCGGCPEWFPGETLADRVGLYRSGV